MTSFLIFLFIGIFVIYLGTRAKYDTRNSKLSRILGVLFSIFGTIIVIFSGIGYLRPHLLIQIFEVFLALLRNVLI